MEREQAYARKEWKVVWNLERQNGRVNFNWARSQRGHQCSYTRSCMTWYIQVSRHLSEPTIRCGRNKTSDLHHSAPLELVTDSIRLVLSESIADRDVLTRIGYDLFLK